MKRKKLALILLSLLLSASFISCNNSNSYYEVLKYNWDVSLPSDYNEIYKSLVDTSLISEGNKYHVFQYNENNFDLDFKKEKNLDLESKILKIVEELDVPEKYMFDFNNDYLYYVLDDKDDSSLYIIDDPNTYKLYVIEHFY